MFKVYAFNNTVKCIFVDKKVVILEIGISQTMHELSFIKLYSWRIMYFHVRFGTLVH